MKTANMFQGLAITDDGRKGARFEHVWNRALCVDRNARDKGLLCFSAKTSGHHFAPERSKEMAEVDTISTRAPVIRSSRTGKSHSMAPQKSTAIGM